ncbi:MAG: hypothetical protein AVDCRST_MAG69-681, partial [uncultured Solirubrobacteraceae bacterium]
GSQCRPVCARAGQGEGPGRRQRRLRAGTQPRHQRRRPALDRRRPAGREDRSGAAQDVVAAQRPGTRRARQGARRRRRPHRGRGYLPSVRRRGQDPARRREPRSSSAQRGHLRRSHARLHRLASAEGVELASLPVLERRRRHLRAHGLRLGRIRRGRIRHSRRTPACGNHRRGIRSGGRRRRRRAQRLADLRPDRGGRHHFGADLPHGPRKRRRRGRGLHPAARSL